MHIGIDVGGTNTDAVVMRGRTVIGSVKSETTRDVASGVQSALDTVMRRAGAAPSQISAVAIGTTQFTNAVIQAHDLARTGVIRLGAPATTGVPPLTAWPPHLVRAIGHHTYVCAGGHEFDGREISPLNPDELKRVAAELAAHDVISIALTSVFSPVNSELEQQAAAIIQAELPHALISLSHEIGRIGLLERENATVINASLLPHAEVITDAFRLALHTADINAPLFLTQNDGTWMDLDYVQRYPVATFAAGPTNSMRGATVLSGLSDCIVMDVGGTTSDAGAVIAGFPRPATTEVDIAGVRTNFRMPDVVSIGIGGGSHVLHDGGNVQVGPSSVGYRLPQEALVFGGSTLTATDIAVAAGLFELGDPGLVAHLDRDLVRHAHDDIVHRIATLADTMRTSRHEVPLVLVGGGSALLPDGMPGFAQVVRPEHFSVANAVGAAMAQVGGEVDRVYSGSERHTALDDAKAEAIDQAIRAGAQPDTVHLVEVEELPIAYLPGGAVRVRVKAVGDVSVEEIVR